MVEDKEIMGMLGLMIRPVFCVKDHKIVKVNSAAEALLITVGMDISPLLQTGAREYAEFSGGCLYLMLNLGGQVLGASVSRVNDLDVFVLEQDADQSELRAMALTARELREPLSSVMITAERLFPMSALAEDDETREQVARLNRGLFQMLRILGNMSDAGHSYPVSRQETLNISSLFSEIFEKANNLIAYTGLTLTYEGLAETVFTLADAEQLERAVLNILSNAVKFTPKGGTIEASLRRKDRFLQLSVQDSGPGIAENILGSVFGRYLRQPTLEDSRFGIGLGMVLIRSAATSHGGTVLIDQPRGTGTRITMTLAIRQSSDTALRSPVMHVDYAGERDHGLIEFSDSLPVELYKK